MSADAALIALITAFDLGASARWMVAWARLILASGRPTNSTACAAATATPSEDVGLADPAASATDWRAGHISLLALEGDDGPPEHRLSGACGATAESRRAAEL